MPFFRMTVAIFGGLFATIRWKALLIFPAIVCFALGVALTQGKVFHYPLAMQRALSFLPGDWEAKAKLDASGSSEWREKMKSLFYKEYFPQHPILGFGYHYDPELAKRDTDIYLSIAARRASVGDEFADVRTFIEQRMPHEGPVHILLATGIVGTVFFVAYCLALLTYGFLGVLKTPPAQVTPLQIWALAMLLPQVLGFFFCFRRSHEFSDPGLPRCHTALSCGTS